MKKFIVPFAATAVLMLGFSCGDGGKNTSSGLENLSGTLSAFSGASGGFELAFADKQAYENVVVIPVKAKDDYVAEHKNLGDYKTLAEGVADGTVIVSEHEGGYESNVRTEEIDRNAPPVHPGFGGGGLFGSGLGGGTTLDMRNRDDNRNGSGSRGGPDVNSLSIENNGDDTVFVMQGELVRGGNQDRVVAEDFVLMPHSGKKDCPVFCVEQSRWTHEGYYNNNTNFGFVNNVVSHSVRKVLATEAEQGKVWSKVAEVTSSNNADSDTKSYNGLEDSEEFTGKRAKYLTALEKAFDKSDRTIGVLVTDKSGRVIGCDIFCKNQLFKKEYKALIHSYITEAITSQSTTTKAAQKNTDNASMYFTSVAEELKSEKPKTEKGTKYIHKSKVLHYSGF